MGGQIGVLFGHDRIGSASIDHLGGADRVKVAEPDFPAPDNLHDSLLAVLTVHALLRVGLEPVVKTGTHDMNIMGVDES